MTRHRRNMRVLALATLLVSACGSTVRVDAGAPDILDATGTEGSVALDDQGLTMDSSVTGTVSTTGGTSVSGSTAGTSTPDAGNTAGSRGGTGGTTTGGTAGGSKATSGGGTTDGAAAAYGPGVTDEEIVLGIAIADEASRQGNQTLLGVEGVTQGNTERYWDIMAEYVNERGGIAGRKVRYAKWRYSTAQGQNLSQLEQQACAYWTQDEPAFAAPAIGSNDNFLGCAHDAGLATWAFDGLTTADDQVFAAYPTHVSQSTMSLTRQARNLADGLEAQRYFDEGYELGVVTFDTPVWKRVVDGTLEPALERHGRVISEKAYVQELRSTHQVGDMTAQLQSIVLRFKTQGITHVIFIDESAVMTLLFARSAENQNYRPRYGLGSQSGGTAIAGQIPPAQYERAVGIGWMPTLDVPASEAPANAAADECLARFAEYGEEPADANNRGIMLNVCEVMSLVIAAAEAGMPDLTADSFGRGVASLGQFLSLNSFQNYFAPGRHDGASHYRHVAYDGGCTCFHYTSGPIADLPR